MADVEKININSTDYDIADAKALRNKDNVGSGTFVDTKAGTTAYPTLGTNLINSIIIGDKAYITNSGTLYDVTVVGATAYAGASYATVIGGNAYALSDSSFVGGYQAKANASSSKSVVLGSAASSYNTLNTVAGYSASANAGNNVVVGAYSIANAGATYSTICGRGSSVSSYCNNSAVLGANATVVQSYSVQLGPGTNSNYGSLQFRDWQVVDMAGKIPEERLPEGIMTATARVPNLYDMDENKLSEQAILYTGVTNSAHTNSQFYRGRTHYGYPQFRCNWVDSDWLDSQNDVMIDQQKLFTKLAEVTKQRIDNNDVENGVLGGDNAEMSIYLHYDADNDYYFLRFDSDSFEKAFNGTPDDISGLSFDDLADYGIYFRNFHKPSGLEGEIEFCDIYYYAPLYIDGYDWNNNPSYMNYLKFLEGINDSDWGIGVVIDGYDTWDFVVDGTSYTCPIIPKTYEYNGDEYDNVEFRWEWNGTDWSEYINGTYCGYEWTTAEMYTKFGIQINSGDESDIEYVGLTVRGAEQRYWEQFNPIDESKFATATAVSSLQSALNVDEENKMFKRFQSARDLDTMTTAGQYRVEANGSTNLPTQASSARYFWLFVTNYANLGNEIRQVLIADHVTMTSGGGDYSRYAPNIFVRCKYNNIWSSWKPLLTDEASVWIQGFKRDTKQMLVHNSNNNTMLWEDVA